MNPAIERIDLIDRRKDLGYEDFVRCYLKPHKPVILEGALREWYAVGKWTPRFFRQEYGDVEVVVDGQRRYLSDLVQLTLESSKECPAPYLRNFPIKEISEDLLADISPVPKYCSPNWLNTHFYPPKIREILGRAVIADIFIGGRGCSFPFLHYDMLNSHAFLSQIYGDKSFVLYSPEQTKWLYRSTEAPNRSLVDNAMEPDLGKFPLLKKAHPIRARLGPGDLLFIPSRWWHAASVLTPSITVSINVANASNWLGLIMDQCRNASSSPSLLNRLATPLLGAYLASVGFYRSVLPLRN